MTSGVAKTNVDWSNASSLCGAGVSPVRIIDLVSRSGKCSLKNSACCSTSGLVGAKIKILLCGNAASRSAATSIATIVFPRPVGKTTRVFAARADFAMDL
jgi:hypothetical protein